MSTCCLFLLWHATRERAFSAAEVAELERRVGAWREMTVVPLRTMRRALKSPPDAGRGGGGRALPHPDQGCRARSRAPAAGGDVRACPRGAVRTRRRRSPRDAARANVAAYEEICRAPFPKPAVETLLAALAGIERKPEE